MAIVCDIKDPLTLDNYSRDPRFVAHKAEEYLLSTGIADTSFWGPELEFYIFNSVRFDQNTHEGYYHIDSDEGIWNTGKNGTANLGYRPKLKSGYFPTPPMDKLQDLRSKIVLALIDAGVHIEVHHHEVGTAGQTEIDMRFDSLVNMADKVLIYKHIVKNVCYQNGYTATFMPKPLFGDNGSGMHTHQSLWKDGVPLFYDKDGYALLSDTARWYIGGLLMHAPAILAFAAPTTNSYRRLVPGYEAPIKLAYSARNRSACIRIPTYSAAPAARRLEFRSPDPMCNPYLSFSACLMAGLDGVRASDRAAEAGRGGPLRARGRGEGAGQGPPRLAHRGAERARGRQRVPHQGRRLHAGPHRHVHRVQARERGRPGGAAATSLRVRPLLRRLSDGSSDTAQPFLDRGPGSSPGPFPCLLRRSGTEDAELVALGIGHDHPADLALTDVGPARSERDEALDLGVLVVGAQVEVDAILHRLPLRHLRKRMSGLSPPGSIHHSPSSGPCSGRPRASLQKEPTSSGSEQSMTMFCQWRDMRVSLWNARSPMPRRRASSSVHGQVSA